MAISSGKNGQIVVPIDLPGTPFAPWLRLAHVTGYEGTPTTAPLRRLRDWELVLQLTGTAWVWWERLGASQVLPAGHLLLIPPGEEHAQAMIGSHLAVHCDLHAQPSLVALDMLVRLSGTRRRADGRVAPVWRLRRPGMDPLDLAAVTPLAAPEAWRERFAPLVRQWLLRRHESPAARLQAAGIIAAAFADLAAEREPDTGDPARVGRELSELLSFLDLDGRNWTVPGLARRAGMGETAFRAAFRRLTGESPRVWLEGRRFERARHLLLTTAMPIQRIAAACGWDDPFHFSRVCRRLAGRGPRELRAISAGDPAAARSRRPRPAPAPR